MGSFCKIKLIKSADKKIKVSLDYAYSRIMSYFYSDGNNNGNTITKHPITERFEKLDVKDLVLTVGKPYCYQFTRLSPEKARSLSEAMAQSGSNYKQILSHYYQNTMVRKVTKEELSGIFDKEGKL